MTVLNKNRVVVAMSGGVDSSVAALLLKEQGMEVIGVSMKTHEEENSSSETARKTCCAARDIRDARLVCQKLDIPFYPLNLKEEFEEKVINYFVSEYGKGRTPNPCVPCNSHLKFSALLEKARQLGAYYLATGHYALKTQDRDGRYHLLRARDEEKDQSYFLFGLEQRQLEHTLFPVGRYTKEEVRDLARSAGLETAEKPESQEICFVTSGHYGEFVGKRLPTLPGSKGVIVDEAGRVLGKHSGVHSYTIGQRRGLGVAGGDRLYVTQLLPQENKVILGPKKALMKKGMVVSQVRWIQPEPVASGAEVLTRIRYRHAGTPSSLTVVDESTLRVDFSHEDGAITPGQAAVFYKGDEVLGGGWIEKGLD